MNAEDLKVRINVEVILVIDDAVLLASTIGDTTYITVIGSEDCKL